MTALVLGDASLYYGTTFDGTKIVGAFMFADGSSFGYPDLVLDPTKFYDVSVDVIARGTGGAELEIYSINDAYDPDTSDFTTLLDVGPVSLAEGATMTLSGTMGPGLADWDDSDEPKFMFFARSCDVTAATFTEQGAEEPTPFAPVGYGWRWVMDAAIEVDEPVTGPVEGVVFGIVSTTAPAPTSLTGGAP